MGEAIYFTKIHFYTEKEAKESFEPIKQFFLEGSKAHNFWQANRMSKDPEGFWIAFKENFPTVSKYLSMLGVLDEDHRNGLAGLLNFGEQSDIIDHMKLNSELDKWFISYWAEVWHFANWEPIADFIYSEYNGVMKWVSNEYLNPFYSKELDW